jgi:hypothetical protein
MVKAMISHAIIEHPRSFPAGFTRERLLLRPDIVDLFVQFSGLHAAWAKGRIVVLVVGTTFAAVIAHFLAIGVFTSN